MSSNKNVINIDGSFGESGGQILRTSCALAAVTGKAVKIKNIRKGRPNPGLQVQHIAAIEALQQLCNANVIGLEKGSAELIFEPGEIKGGTIDINISTAGSVGLVLQGLMIASMHAKSPVFININGGATNGKWAAPVYYLQQVLLHLLKNIGYKCDIFNIDRYGYYPQGGAKVRMEIMPSTLKPLRLTERGRLCGIQGISHASLQLKNSRVAERQAKSAEEIIRKNVECNFVCIEPIYVDTQNIGTAMDIYASYENTILGADALGELKKKAEDVGKEAAMQLIKQINSEGCVDEYAEDQLLPYMALAAAQNDAQNASIRSGISHLKVGHMTKHTQTNIWAIENFLPVKFEVQGNIISCRKV